MFRINTDNPISILWQEKANTLLSVESPKYLYSSFQKATLLKQGADQYMSAEIELEKIRPIVRLISKIGNQVDIQMGPNENGPSCPLMDKQAYFGACPYRLTNFPMKQEQNLSSQSNMLIANLEVTQSYDKSMPQLRTQNSGCSGERQGYYWNKTFS